MPKSAIETTSLDAIEFKAINGNISVDEAKGIVECFVAAIGNKDSVGDIIIAGAFDASLKRRKPRVVWGHDWNQPIGKVLDIYEVGPRDPRLPAKMRQAGVGGLFAKVQFNLKSERGREAFANLVFYGEEQEWSIGYKTLDAVYDNQRQANILKEVELYEVSPVLHGANQLTATISIKSDNGDKKIDSFRKSKWPMFDREFARMIKEEHPEIWAAGGNIKGNDQYEILTKIAEQGGAAKTPDQINALELREAWVARHEGDFLLPGVIAQIKWLAIGSRGEGHMKDVVREAIAKRKERSEKSDLTDEADEKGYGMPGGNMGQYPMQVARALAARMGGMVRIRELDKNMVVFDHAEGDDMETMRVSYHFDGEQFMFGDPEKVTPKVVYITDVDNDDPVGDDDDENEGPRYKAPQDVVLDLPQEAFTGEVLRGYGPRRGNLERLLRYWRPIMRKPGGFRRCRVILADHPDLYPLERICAWLHHETTGMWPNEGCHHPGMKNCRRKLRGVVNGSIWSDSEWNNRLARLGGKKSMWDNDDDPVTDEDIAFANKVLREFMDSEKEFMDYLADDKNWMHEGQDEDDNWKEHSWVGENPMGMGISRPGGCGCGGGCGGKQDDLDDLLVKAGRVLSSSNMDKIQQAISMLQQVIVAAGGDTQPMQMKDNALISVPMEDLFALKSHLEPVLDFYGVETEASEAGLEILDPSSLSEDAVSALTRAIKSYNTDISTKALWDL